MADVTDVPTGGELARRIARWRPWLDVLGLGVALASVAVIVGGVIRVFDPDLRVGFAAYGGWDRIRVLVNTTAQPVMLVAAAVTLVLVLMLRVLFRWPGGTPSGVARAAVLGAMLVAVWLVVIRGLSLIADTFANEIGSFGATNGFEQFEVVVAGIGTWLGSAVLIYVGVHGLALLRSPRDERPPPGEVAEPAAGRAMS